VTTILFPAQAYIFLSKAPLLLLYHLPPGHFYTSFTYTISIKISSNRTPDLRQLDTRTQTLGDQVNLRTNALNNRLHHLVAANILQRLTQLKTVNHAPRLARLELSLTVFVGRNRTLAHSTWAQAAEFGKRKAASGQCPAPIATVVVESAAKKGTSANLAYLPFALDVIAAHGTGNRKWYVFILHLHFDLSLHLLPSSGVYMRRRTQQLTENSVTNNCGRPFPTPDCFVNGHFNWCAPHRRAVGEKSTVCGASSSSGCKIVHWGMYTLQIDVDIMLTV
jgi:hypothetical protein